MKKFKPTLFPTLFTIPALILLLWLGTWQVHRLQWKTQLIADITRQMTQPAIPLPKHIDPDSFRYRKVTVTGRFENDKEIYLYSGPIEFKGEDGYDILTPFKEEDGSVILIDRGWVPANKKLPEDRPGSELSGIVTIDGEVMKDEHKAYFIPDNPGSFENQVDSLVNKVFGKQLDDTTKQAALNAINVTLKDFLKAPLKLHDTENKSDFIEPLQNAIKEKYKADTPNELEEFLKEVSTLPKDILPKDNPLKTYRNHNIWFWIDMPAIGGRMHENLPPYYILEAPHSGADKRHYPIGQEISVTNIRNDHLQYAITWYSAALSLLVIYYLYHRKEE